MDIRKIPLKAFYYLVGRLYRHDNRIALNLFDYFPSYRAAAGELFNQLCRICGLDFSCAVQGVVVEPTNACNLRCRHCTAQNAPGKKGYMDYGMFVKLLDENPQLTSMILTRNGEPFLHPQIFKMIEYAKRRGIYVIAYTNGALLDDRIIENVFSCGLDELNFSLEGVGEYYEKNRGVDYKQCASTIRKILRARTEASSRTKIGINTVTFENGSGLSDVAREWGGVVDHITYEPLMGKRAELRRSACRTLWRNSVITWEGDVVVCCSDIEGKLKVGNINDSTLREIFNGPEMRALRQRHLRKEFPEICKYCDPHFG